MQATIKKWGNRPALRLSAALMQMAQLELDQEVNIQVRQGKLIIDPVRSKEYDLAKLVEGIDAANRHTEVDFGGPVGLEML